MKFAIIADDLTGANDSGVQLSKHGILTSVFLKQDYKSLLNFDAVVFDTDSRAIEPEEAQKKVERITRYLLDNNFNNIYKKIDSTMRGNIGKELIGFHNRLKTDFIFVVAAHPKNKRTVINGNLYLKDKLLSETEIANDPVTPVRESHIPTLLSQQINMEVGHINLELLHKGMASILTYLKELNQRHIRYVVVDSKIEDDLQLILEVTKNIGYSIGWSGSAGLVNYFPNFLNIVQKQKKVKIKNYYKPILTIVGSVNINSRKQLQVLLKEKSIYGIKIKSYKAVSDEKIKEEEISRVVSEASNAVQKGFNVVIYSSGKLEDINQAREVGEKNGFNFTQTSKEIVNMIGDVTSILMKKKLFQGIVMTGGDTAKRISEKCSVTGFQLYDELETGIPISKFIGIDDVHVITKAGGFGTETVFLNAIELLKGGDI